MGLDRRWFYVLLAAALLRGLVVALMPFDALNDAEYHLALARSLATGAITPWQPTGASLFHLLAAPFVRMPYVFIAGVNLLFLAVCFFLVRKTSRSRLHFLLLALNPLTLIYGASLYSDLLALAFVVLAVALEKVNRLALSGLLFVAALLTRLNGVLPAFPVFAERTKNFPLFFWPFVVLVLITYSLYNRVLGVVPVFAPNPVSLGLTLLFLLPLLFLPQALAWQRGLFLLVISLHMVVMSGSIEARYLLPFLPLLFDGMDFRRLRTPALAYLGAGLCVGAVFLAHFFFKAGGLGT